MVQNGVSGSGTDTADSVSYAALRTVLYTTKHGRLDLYYYGVNSRTYIETSWSGSGIGSEQTKEATSA